MATFNGKHENLRFRCKSCNYKSTIDVDLSDVEDKEKLWSWLKTHSECGGDYINVPVDFEKIEVSKRTNEQHQALIKKHGGIREYLISMGAFKE